MVASGPVNHIVQGSQYFLIQVYSKGWYIGTLDSGSRLLRHEIDLISKQWVARYVYMNKQVLRIVHVDTIPCPFGMSTSLSSMMLIYSSTCFKLPA